LNPRFVWMMRLGDSGFRAWESGLGVETGTLNSDHFMLMLGGGGLELRVGIWKAKRFRIVQTWASEMDVGPWDLGGLVFRLVL